MKPNLLSLGFNSVKPYYVSYGRGRSFCASYVHQSIPDLYASTEWAFNARTVKFIHFSKLADYIHNVNRKPSAKNTDDSIFNIF